MKTRKELILMNLMIDLLNNRSMNLQLRPSPTICHATARRPPVPVNYMSWFPSELRGKTVSSTESPYSSRVLKQDN